MLGVSPISVHQSYGMDIDTPSRTYTAQNEKQLDEELKKDLIDIVKSEGIEGLDKCFERLKQAAHQGSFLASCFLAKDYQDKGITDQAGYFKTLYEQYKSEQKEQEKDLPFRTCRRDFFFLENYDLQDLGARLYGYANAYQTPWLFESLNLIDELYKYHYNCVKGYAPEKALICLLYLMGDNTLETSIRTNALQLIRIGTTGNYTPDFHQKVLSFLNEGKLEPYYTCGLLGIVEDNSGCSSLEKQTLRKDVEAHLLAQSSQWFTTIVSALNKEYRSLGLREIRYGPLDALKIIIQHFLFSREDGLDHFSLDYYIEPLAWGALQLNSKDLYDDLFKTLINGRKNPTPEILWKLYEITCRSPYHTPEEKEYLRSSVDRNSAAIQSPWYAKAVEILNSCAHFENPSYQTDSPRIIIEKLVTTLISHSYGDNDKKYTEEQKLSLFQCLAQGAMQLNEDRIYDSILEAIINKYKRSEHCLTLLQTFETVPSFVTTHKEKLAKAYLSIANNFYEIVEDEVSRTQAGLLEQALLHAYQADYDTTHPEAIHILDLLTGSYRKDGLFLLPFFQLVDPDLYTTYTTKILEERMGALVKFLLEDGMLRQKVQGTVLSLDQVIPFLLKQLSCPIPEEQGMTGKHYDLERTFETFIEKGVKQFPQFEDLLIDHLPKILMHYGSVAPSCGILLKNSRLGDRVFPLLIQYIVSKPVKEDWFCNRKSLTDRIFKEGNSAFPTTTLLNPELLNWVYQEFKQTNQDYALQKFWGFIEILTRSPEHLDARKVLFAQVYDYFNPGALFPPDQDLSDWGAFFNILFQRALQQGKRPLVDLFHFSQTAEKTKLGECITPEIKRLLNEQILWDNSLPLKERCEAFNRIVLGGWPNVEVFEAFQSRFEASLEESPLKIYGTLAFKAFQSQPIHQLLTLKREIVQLEKKYPDLVVHFYFTKFLNVLDWDTRQHLEKECYIIDKLSFPTIGSDGHIYGLKRKNQNLYKFYKCDGQTGDALWYLNCHFSLLGNEAHHYPPFAVGSHGVHIVTNKNETLHVNPETGNYVTLRLSDMVLPITFMGGTNNDHLFIVRENAESHEFFLSAVNCATNKFWTKQLPFFVAHYIFKTSGNYFVYSHSEKISIVNVEGEEGIIEGNLVGKTNYRFSPQWSISPHPLGDQLLFDQLTGKEEYKLICRNLITNQDQWVFDLKSYYLQCPAIVNPQGDKAFLLLANRFSSGGKKVVSLGFQGEQAGQLLWESRPLKHSAHQLFVTQNNVYTLSSSHNELYRFDVLTGEGKKSEEKVPSHSSFIGSFQTGKIYIGQRI